MPNKSCSRCNAPAQFSLCFLLSTVGTAPRQQKCTRSALFCSACIRALCETLARVAPDSFIEPLQGAYAAMLTAPSEPVEGARRGVAEREGSLNRPVARPIGPRPAGR